MKKIIALCFALCALTVSAQRITRLTTPFNGTPAALSTPKAQVKAQASELAEDCFLVGYETGDAISSYNGITSYPYPDARIGSALPTSMFQKGEIIGVRFALKEPIGATNVILQLIDNEGYLCDTIAIGEYEDTQAGWNTVMFDGSVELPLESQYTQLLVSYQYTQGTTNKPIGFFSTLHEGGMMYYATISGYGTGWFQFNGNDVAIQLIIRYDLPERSVDIKSVEIPTSTINTEVTTKVKIESYSQEPITSIGYNLEIDGTDHNYTYTFSKPIAAGMKQAGEFPITFTTPDEAGSHSLNLTVTSLNGQEPSVETAVEIPYSLVTRAEPRFSIVEELTGTGCGWCPRGWVGMNKVKAECDSEAAVIAIHRYNSNDPMYPAYYKMPVSLSGAPSSVVDRNNVQIDPYYGSDQEGIVAYTRSCTKVLPEATINLTAKFSDDLKKVDCTASVEFLTDLEESRIVFVVTADGLTGTTSAWAQSNYYTSYSTNQVPKDIAPFARGGEWGTDAVNLVFDDVLIGSSWISNTINAAPKFYSPTTYAQETLSYSVVMPTKTTLKKALLYDKMYAIAYILKEDGSIAQGAHCRVALPEGIQGVSSESAATPCNYDLQGRKVNAMTKGLFIMNGHKVIR